MVAITSGHPPSCQIWGNSDKRWRPGTEVKKIIQVWWLFYFIFIFYFTDSRTHAQTKRGGRCGRAVRQNTWFRARTNHFGGRKYTGCKFSGVLPQNAQNCPNPKNIVSHVEFKVELRENAYVIIPSANSIMSIEDGQSNESNLLDLRLTFDLFFKVIGYRKCQAVFRKCGGRFGGVVCQTTRFRAGTNPFGVRNTRDTNLGVFYPKPHKLLTN